MLEFSNVTLLCGGNGSGKTTLLNLITEHLKIPRSTPFNRSEFFDAFTNNCSATMNDDEDGDPYPVPNESRHIASDDVFQNIFRLRKTTDTVAKERARTLKKYYGLTSDAVKNIDLLENRDILKDFCDSQHKTCSSYVRERVQSTRRQRSNGESAFVHFTEIIGEDALYLLDEPENSLSPALQLELLDFLIQCSRLNNQFIIATHSPLLLSFPGARIYNLDTTPVSTPEWEQLPHVRLYATFFKHHASLFETT